MRTKNHTKETIIAPDRTGVDKMARNIRWAMRIVAASLVFIFGWLKLKGIDFVPLAQDLPADILLKSSLALYYCCWVAGTAFDLDAQAAVYATAPNKGRIPLGGLGLICSVGFGFGLLCWIESFRAFFFALLAFWSLDWIGWRYLHAVVRKTLEQSRKVYNSDRKWKELAKLEFLTKFMFGPWKKYRYIAGAVLLTVVFIMIYTPLAETVSNGTWMSSQFVKALSICAYILLMETWMWFMRLRYWITNELIDELAADYAWSPTSVQ